MAQGSGYFWGGFAQGLGSGIQYKLQIDEAKERKRAKEEAKQLQSQIIMEGKRFGEAIDEAYADGNFTDTDYAKLVGLATAAMPELQDRFLSIAKELRSGRLEQAKTEMEALKSTMSYFKDINFAKLSSEDIDSLFTELDKQFVSPQGKQTLSIAKEYARTKYKTEQVAPEELAFQQAAILPQEVRPEYLRQKGIPIPEVPTELQRKFAEIDKMPGLPEDAKLRAKLKALGISESPTEEKIRLAYQMGASDEDIRDYIILGKRPTTTGTATTQKETQKYSINDARIISDAIDLYDFVTSAYGAPTALTEEQRQNILQSVQSMQAGLQPPVYALLVNMLDMGGYLPSGTPTPAPENKKESSLLQDAVSWVKAKFNQWFGGNPPQPTPSQPTEMQPAPSVSEIPRMPATAPTTTPETPGTKNYQNMTDDELYNLVVNEQDGLAYDELKRRGYPLP